MIVCVHTVRVPTDPPLILMTLSPPRDPPLNLMTVSQHPGRSYFGDLRSFQGTGHTYKSKSVITVLMVTTTGTLFATAETPTTKPLGEDNDQVKILLRPMIVYKILSVTDDRLWLCG